ncbi:MAG: hypothetical protein ABIJ41_02770 [Candidatus Omnitrophota bacterium]
MKYILIILFVLLSANCLVPSVYGQNQEIDCEQFAVLFQARVKMLIGYLEDYFKNKGVYAASEGTARFSDIGLDSALWSRKIINGLIYDPRGDQLRVRPAQEYTIFVDDIGGITRIITSILKWDLIYDLRTKEWYVHTIDPKNVIDILTFKIKKDSPYNPNEYRIQPPQPVP